MNKYDVYIVNNIQDVVSAQIYSKTTIKHVEDITQKHTKASVLHGTAWTEEGDNLRD